MPYPVNPVSSPVAFSPRVLNPSFPVTAVPGTPSAPGAGAPHMVTMPGVVPLPLGHVAPPWSPPGPAMVAGSPARNGGLVAQTTPKVEGRAPPIKFHSNK